MDNNVNDTQAQTGVTPEQVPVQGIQPVAPVPEVPVSPAPEVPVQQTVPVQNAPVETAPVSQEATSTPAVPEAQPAQTAQPVQPVQPVVQTQAAPVQQAAPVASNPTPPLTQGVITNKAMQKNQIAQATEKIKATFSQKGNTKTILLIVIVFVAFFFIYNTFFKQKKAVVRPPQTETAEIVEIDVGSKWGNEYAKEVQNIYFDNKVNKMDITFINLDLRGEVEMIAKFLDEDEKEYTVIYYFDDATENLKKTRTFTNCEFNLLYSLVDNQANWYLHNILERDRYGNYIRVRKLLDGTATEPDIKTTNETLISDFESKYVTSSYKPIFYEVKKDSFVKDFQTIYDRIDEYDDAIDEEIDKLDDKYGNTTIEEVIKDDHLTAGPYVLHFGDYIPKPTDNDSQINKELRDIEIKLNNNYTIVMDGQIIKYTINHTTLKLDTGVELRIIDNDQFIYDVGGGMLYKYNEPVVPEDPDKEEDPDKPQGPDKTLE